MTAKPTAGREDQRSKILELIFFILLFSLISLMGVNQADAETIDDIDINTFIMGGDIYNMDSNNLNKANVLWSYNAGGVTCYFRSPFTPYNWYTIVGGSNDATSKADISGVNANVKKLSSAQLNAIPLRFWFKSGATIERVPLRTDVISIANNTGSNDTISITGVFPGDVIKVYSAAAGGSPIVQGTVPANQYNMQLSVAQLGTTAGNVYISATSTFSSTLYESTRTTKSYAAEGAAPPGAPQNLAAQAGDGCINLTWDAVPGASSYKIYCSTQEVGGYTEISNGITSNNFSNGLLNPGQRYYYMVTAVAGSLESGYSNSATAISNVDDQGNVYHGNRILVSNESTDETSTESTGSLDAGNDVQMDIMPSNLPLGAYRIDPNLPIHDQDGAMPIRPSINNDGNVTTYVVGDERSFYVIDFVQNEYKSIIAKLLYDGTHAQVWVEKNSTVNLTSAKAQTLGLEFDNNIYPAVRDNFYEESDLNGDNKVSILCFDIQEGYPDVGYYIGGYFNGDDLLAQSPNNPCPNGMEIFYIDTYPNMGKVKTDPDVSAAYSTLAHEFQHMVNFNCNYLNQGQVSMDTWLNEGLSLAAEHVYNGVQTDRIDNYNSFTAIRDGRSLLYWDENDSLPNYALSYLFSQYLRTQIEQSSSYNGQKFFREIIEDTAPNYQAVENVIHTYINSGLTFGQFMTMFRAALLLKAESGPYGFNGESDFASITTQLYTGTGTNIRGGGAVVKAISSPFTAPGNQGADVGYAGIYQTVQ